MTGFPSTPRCSFSISNSITDCCQGVAKAASFTSPPRSKGFTRCACDLLSSWPEQICGGEGEEMCRWQEISSDSSVKVWIWFLAFGLKNSSVHCFRGEDVECHLVLLQMLLASHLYLVCRSHCGPRSNLLHRSGGFNEVSGNLNNKLPSWELMQEKYLMDRIWVW